ncbi:MAG: DUF4040 domain-containing protein [Clostridia bacterium]|nr:DUF4040 domain-containing protein [Clostridia bacterium]
MNIIEIIVSLLLVISGILIVFSKDIIKTIIYLSILSMLSAVAFVLLKAPDVAMTEVVIGSGLITFLFLVTVKQVNKVGDHK